MSYYLTMATRSNQKERTRQAIVAATARLVDNGHGNPSIDDVAEEALVSRATVYRYFDSTNDLVWQVYSDRHMDTVGATLPDCDDLTQRVLTAEANINDYIFGNEQQTRAFERVMLERHLQGRTTDQDRPGRRFLQIDAALAPLQGQLDADQMELVRHALSLAIGSQSMVALLDTGRLNPERARDVTTFVCRAIISEVDRMLAADPAPA